MNFFRDTLLLCILNFIMKINSFRDDVNDVPAITKILLVIAESLTSVFVLAERSVRPPKMFMITIRKQFVSDQSISK